MPIPQLLAGSNTFYMFFEDIFNMTKIMGRDSATGRSTAHRAGAGGDNTGGVIASGVVGDLATHWAQAAARAAAAGDVRAGGQAAHRLAAPGPVATGITAGPTAGGAETARSVAGGARAGGLRAGWRCTQAGSTGACSSWRCSK